MNYVRKLAVGYNNCIQDVDFYVRHALTPVMLNLQLRLRCASGAIFIAAQSQLRTLS
jgi:hypothetical protein